jgi:hypothetical protein
VSLFSSGNIRVLLSLLLLWLYNPLLSLGRFFSILILYKVGRTPWTGDQPVARPLPTHRTTAHRHPCLEWDSNPRSQRSSERRQLMLQTARPLGSAFHNLTDAVFFLLQLHLYFLICVLFLLYHWSVKIVPNMKSFVFIFQYFGTLWYTGVFQNGDSDTI